MRVAARHEVTSRWPRCSFWHELTSFWPALTSRDCLTRSTMKGRHLRLRNGAAEQPHARTIVKCAPTSRSTICPWSLMPVATLPYVPLGSLSVF
jgi:hypothetical protein